MRPINTKFAGWSFLGLLALISAFTMSFQVVSGIHTKDEIIVGGKGTSQVQLGDKIERVFRQLHKEVEPELDVYYVFADQGLDVKRDEQKPVVVALFFYFKDKSHQPFAGVTDRGIGASSTVADVEKAYGAPSFSQQRIEHNHTDCPDVEERFLSYASEGIAFQFFDNKLSVVTVSNKR